MKRNFLVRLAVLSVVLTFVTSYMVSGTFAKYTTSITGTDSARVATFTVKANGFSAANVAVFDLFNTIKDSNGTSGETDVASGLVAPGTSGSVELLLENDAEVTVSYAVDFTATLAGVPIEFSVDNATWKTNINDIDVSATNIAVGGADVTVTVYWRWAFFVDAAGDTADTALGTAGTATPSVEAKVTFTQVD